MDSLEFTVTTNYIFKWVVMHYYVVKLVHNYNTFTPEIKVTPL